jgi:hypothetical protein
MRESDSRQRDGDERWFEWGRVQYQQQRADGCEMKEGRGVPTISQLERIGEDQDTLPN